MKRRTFLAGLAGSSFGIAGLVNELSHDPKPNKYGHEFLPGVKEGLYLANLPSIIPGYSITIEKADGSAILNNSIHLSREKDYRGKSIDWITAVYCGKDLCRISMSEGKHTIHFDVMYGNPFVKKPMERDAISYRRVGMGYIYALYAGNAKNTGKLQNARHVNGLYRESIDLVKKVENAAQKLIQIPN